MKIILGIVLSVVLATGSWADANEKANALFAEAVQLWKQAEVIEGDSLEELEKRLELLEQIGANLDSIVSDYPGSNLAVQLLIGSVGPLNVAEVDEQLEVLNNAIWCQQNLRDCLIQEALEVAGSIEDADGRSWALFSVYASLGDVDGALLAARSIEDADSRSRALAVVANLLPKD